MTISCADRRRSSWWFLLAFVVVGCGSGMEEFPTAGVTGTVTCEGNPVPNARVYFFPKSSGTSANAGKSGWGTTTDMGNFVISTYGTEDGAVVGTHRVSVAPPSPGRFPDFTCDCVTGGNEMLTTVEVVADGTNTFAIELPSKAETKLPPPTYDEDLDDIQDKD